MMFKIEVEMRRRIACLLLVLAIAVVENVARVAATRAVSFTTTEGTWMNVDVAPDGRTLAFDLLGDIYTLPMSGGKATRRTDGRAYDMQPRWSPDGRSIAFTSDRSGSDNIWVMAADGSAIEAVTREKDGGLTAPAWAPDGQYLAVRRDPTYNRRGSAELWLYHRSGGTGVRLTARDAHGGLNPNGPVFSPDGRSIYFSHGQRVLDSTWVPWQVWRLDRRTGDLTPVTTGFGGAVRPAISRDGRSLAYVRRDHATSTLMLRDLETGSTREVRTGLDRDDQRGTTDYDAYPGFAFAPDGGSITIGTGGKLRRVPIEGGVGTEIPFSADVAFDLPERPYTEQRIEDGDVRARVIRWAGFTPDGRTLIFEALGKIWIQQPGGPPRRLNPEPQREYAPAISPDGRWVAYVSWDDRAGGQVWKRPIAGGAPQKLTRVARQYANPSWSVDGSKLVVAWRSPNFGATANLTEDDPYHEIVWLSADGGDTHPVSVARARSAGRWYPVPRFAAGDERICFITAASDTRNDFVCARLDGSDRRALARFKYVEEAALSPDGRQLAFVAMDDLFVVSLPDQHATPIDIDIDKPLTPLRRLTGDGGSYLAWTADGKALTWSYANSAYKQTLEAAAPTRIDVDLRVPRALPSGSILLRGARLITMNGNEVIERGDILVTRNRIAAVGAIGTLTVPAGAKIEDVTGKTIIPGIVDAHYHGHYAGQEIFPVDKWQYVADLAYGVTTGREVSAPTRDTVAQADMVETGDMIGPRIYGSGWPLFAAAEGGSNHAVSIATAEDALRHVRRLKRNGVTYLKQYLQPRREQRQWLQQAALAEGLMITAEGGGLKVQTTLMLDGFTGFEHGIPAAPIYNDLIQLLVRSGIVYTPTFVAGYAKPGSMDYFYATRDVHGDARANKFMPHDLLDRLTTVRTVITDDQYLFRAAARGAEAVRKAGGRVAVGGHGNHPGLGPHWELWSFVEGGMAPLEALRAATAGGAELLGIQKDVGSLQPGFIADLIILNADPMGDIHRTTDVSRVMKNGLIYDPEELAKRIKQ